MRLEWAGLLVWIMHRGTRWERRTTQFDKMFLHFLFVNLFINLLCLENLAGWIFLCACFVFFVCHHENGGVNRGKKAKFSWANGIVNRKKAKCRKRKALKIYSAFFIILISIRREKEGNFPHKNSREMITWKNFKRIPVRSVEFSQ